MDNVLLYFSLKYNGNWDKIFEALENKEKIDFKDLKDVKNRIKCNFITLLSPIYPVSLKNSYKPPFVLFYVGNINMLLDNNHFLSLYLSNDHEELSKKSVDCTLLEAIKNDYTIVVSNDNENLKNYFVDQLEKNNKVIITINDNIYDFFLNHNIDYSDNFVNTLFISTHYNRAEKTSECEYSFNDLQSNLSNYAIFINCIQTKQFINIFNYLVNEGKEVLSIPETEYSNALNAKFIKFGENILKSLQ
ncbi:DNA processing/uptake protein [Spiroplasma litorale]|uniref:DNA processing/uptake protein n=1 Tax=Spiroplasma litorale TaxID=216942 RepID=A0A0K1W263_9MOLU|nr:hypothetical protein [Spiroplasma litorale]AKX34419.1 DNA processing/uptake protein [Spiroplasma litorale]